VWEMSFSRGGETVVVSRGAGDSGMMPVDVMEVVTAVGKYVAAPHGESSSRRAVFN